MVRNCARTSLAAAVLLLLSRFTAGAVTSAEDLTGCRLPNGTVVLPAPGTAEGAKGALFKFDHKALTAAPASDDGKAVTPDQIIAKVRAAKSADVQYLPEFSGLWAFSGCITELPGVGFLSETKGKKLEAPMEIMGTSRNPDGLYDNIREGRVYLLQTTDKRFVLLRVLEKSKTMVVLQYVYQPDGSISFEVPANLMVPYRTPAEAQTQAAGGGSGVAPVATAPASIAATNAIPRADAISPPPDLTRLPASGTRPAGAVPGLPRQELGPDDYVAPGYIITGHSAQATTSGLESTMNAFVQQRAQMIQRRMDIVRAPATTNTDIDTKAQAIYDLGTLHADEAADLLVSQIAFFNTRSSAREFSADALHPVVAALKRLGKPATAAAIKGLKQLDLNAGDGIDSDRYKADLLTMVLGAVETKDVAAFILRHELEGETDARRKAVLEYVLGKIEAQQG
jgi:hypothetical protein